MSLPINNNKGKVRAKKITFVIYELLVITNLLTKRFQKIVQKDLMYSKSNLKSLSVHFM